MTWLMEVFPAVIAFAFMWSAHKNFPLTPLLYALIAIHRLILMLGDTYAHVKVPLGGWGRIGLGIRVITTTNMFYAMTGAIAALVMLMRWRNKEIRKQIREL